MTTNYMCWCFDDEGWGLTTDVRPCDLFVHVDWCTKMRKAQLAMRKHMWVLTPWKYTDRACKNIGGPLWPHESALKWMKEKETTRNNIQLILLLEGRVQHVMVHFVNQRPRDDVTEDRFPAFGPQRISVHDHRLPKIRVPPKRVPVDNGQYLGPWSWLHQDIPATKVAMSENGSVGLWII